MRPIPTPARLCHRITAAIVCVVTGASAQSMGVERRAYTRLERLRTELAVAWLAAEPEARARAAAICAEPIDSQPFLTITRALLTARGVEVDDAALYRGGIVAMPLPEIVDQDVFQALHVTAHAPRILPDLAAVRFRVTLHHADAAGPDGAPIAEQWIDDRTALEDVLRFRATTSLPMVELAEGEYRVRVETWFGDAGPRAHDVVHDAPVWVLRSFKTRAEALPVPLSGSAERLEQVAALVGSIPEARRDPLSRALLFGALWQVERVYRAEPRLPGVDPVVDLARAERIFANLRDDRPALDGIAGRVVVGLPVPDGDDATGDEIVQVSVDLPPARDADTPRPLVVVVPAVPAWDSQADRPISARTVAPSLIHDRLDRVGFDRESRFHVAVLESPGRFASAPAAIRAATGALRELLTVGDQPVIWIGEREGAYAVSRAIVDEPTAADAVVLVAGLGLTVADVTSLAELKLLAVPAAGHAATAMLQRVVAQVDDPDRVRGLEVGDAPWPIALAVRAAEIEAFVREVTAR